MPEISVIMPVYNTPGEWLSEAIESILNQTFKDFEFIIVNDGSTNENVEKIIKSYDDERIKYIYQANAGVAAALNTGLDAASGRYIARMDSDDISMPDRFEKQIEYFKNHSNISVLGSWINIFPEKEVFKPLENPKYLDFFKFNVITHPSVMFIKSDFDKYNLKYNPEYKCEDYELWSRAVRYLKFANIQEALLQYRRHGSNMTDSPQLIEDDKKVKRNMLDFLSSDSELKQKINEIFFPPEDKKYKLHEYIFSIKNTYNKNGRHKIITAAGLKFKFKKYENNRIVSLMGGLGNQMFQYAFGRALEAKTGLKVSYTNSWFEDVKSEIVNEKNENSDGVVMRRYALDIFNLDITFASREQIAGCKNTPKEKDAFEFCPELLKKQKSAFYEGYFQNENYFINIKDEIKKAFTFPEIPADDEFNKTWLKKIRECENSVFIHLRRGDYVNLGWNLPAAYYKKSIEYIKERVKDPVFFVFGQDCSDYIEKEFNIDTRFEIIGETNSKNKEDWKDMLLMSECRHGIIANSTFSWWAAWLGKADNYTLAPCGRGQGEGSKSGVITAPSPFVNGKDGIICNTWVKIKFRD